MVKSKIRVMEIEERRIEKASEEVVEAEVVRADSPTDRTDKPDSSDKNVCPVVSSDNDSDRASLDGVLDSQDSDDGLPFE
jgi:hypothetical protein